MNADTGTWREHLTLAISTFVPGTRTERLFLLLLLLLALILRFWGFPNIPYTHDEISALVRVDYPTLHDAIMKGVWGIDTHPPGVHAFLWCWTQLFGFGDGAVKAPFIVASVIALFFLYRFAYAWAGGPVAMITTALFATMQYTVMYGQIARPYAMGLFTTALVADQMTRYIGSGSMRALIGLSLAAVLSAYTHHFALMLAALMYLSGIVFITPPQRKAYLIAGVVMAVCYAPNVPLFFAQLNWKGLDEWLAPPGADWLPNYVWWIAHCSIAFAIVLSGLLLLAAGLRIKHEVGSKPLGIILLVWGILPLAIGYAYSVWRAPVLQYSVVLFSFPYLLIPLLAGLRYLKTPAAIIIAAITAGTAVFTLVFQRRHYEVFYNSKYEAIVRGVIAAEDEKRLAVVDMPPEVLGFYRKLWCVRPSQGPCVNLREGGSVALASALRHTSLHGIFYGQFSLAAPENVAIIQARFPFLMERKDYVEGQTFRFDARPVPGHTDDIGQKRLMTPQAIEGKGWEVSSKLALVSDTGTSYIQPPKRWDMTGHEFGVLYEDYVINLANTDQDIIEVRADVEHLDAVSDLMLVVELKDGEGQRFYRNATVRTLDHADGRASLIAAVKLADISGHGDGTRVRAYLWNHSRRSAWIASLGVQVREGDPVLYGFFEPIVQAWRFK